MIDDFMPIRLNLPDDADVLRIAELAKIDDDAAAGKLLRVWAWAQRNSVDGRLEGSRRAVDRIALCKGFADAMIAVGWLQVDDESGTVQIPKWEKWNSKAAKKRAYDRDRQRDLRGSSRDKSATFVAENVRQTGYREEEEEEEEEIQEERQEQEETGAGFPNGKPRAAKAAPVDRSADIRAVFEHYRKYHPKSHPKPKSTSKEWRLIRARLDDGYSVADLCLAIDGNHKCPWNCGENPGNKLYQSLELIVRDGSKVAHFIEYADGPRPVVSEKSARALRAAQDFLADYDDHGGNLDGTF